MVLPILCAFANLSLRRTIIICVSSPGRKPNSLINSSDVALPLHELINLLLTLKELFWVYRAESPGKSISSRLRKWVTWMLRHHTIKIASQTFSLIRMHPSPPFLHRISHISSPFPLRVLLTTSPYFYLIHADGCRRELSNTEKDYCFDCEKKR